MASRRLDSQGGAAVEFALVLPLLLLLLFGIVEFGLALYRFQAVAAAGREGARFGIRHTVPRPTAGDIERTVRNVLSQAGIPVTDLQVLVTGARGASGSDLVVQVEVPHRYVAIPHLAPGVGASVVLRSRTVMKHE